MRNKRTTVEKAEIESKHDVDVPGAHSVGDVSTLHSDIHYYRARIDIYVIPIISVMSVLLVALLSKKVVSLLPSNLSQTPQAYATLIGIVVSSIVGISVTFLLARLIDKKRKAEREEVIERVRFEEKELFEMLDLDLDSIIKRRELSAPQTN
jgi:Na+/phosphate symporter